MRDFYSAKDIARLLGWRTQRAKRWLKTSGAGFKRGRGASAHWYTTPERLQAEFPELLDVLARKRAEALTDGQEQAQSGTSGQSPVS